MSISRELLDTVRCRLALSGGDDIAPAEAMRLCRTVALGQDRSHSGAGELYAALLAEGDVVPVDTLFGPRLGMTEDLIRRAGQALAASAPRLRPVAEDAATTLFGAPTLLHDLITLAGFVVRDQPRVTGRGLLSAPSLRRLGGLAVSPESAVPLLERHAVDGARLWQFLFRFLCAGGDVVLGSGRAHARDRLLQAIAWRPRAWSASLFAFAASRMPVSDTAWLSSLRGPLPARVDLSSLAAWLERMGADPAKPTLERVLALLAGLGFVRLSSGRDATLLASFRLLWDEDPADPDRSDPDRLVPADAALALPGGGHAVDLVAGDPSLGARVTRELRAGPESTGHVIVYGIAAEAGRHGAAGAGTMAAALAGIVTGDDEALVNAVADAMAERVLGRWRGGVAVEALALEEAIERLEALGARVARLAPGAGPTPPSAADAGPRTRAALPWTLERCRSGAWASGSAPAVQPLRTPAPISLSAAEALPTAAARLRAAARLGWLVDLVLESGPEGGDVVRLCLPLGVRWQSDGEWLDLLWAQGAEEGGSVPLSAIRRASLHRPDRSAEDARAGVAP